MQADGLVLVLLDEATARQVLSAQLILLVLLMRWRTATSALLYCMTVAMYRYVLNNAIQRSPLRLVATAILMPA